MASRFDQDADPQRQGQAGPAGKENDKAPRLPHLRRHTEFGAAWKKTAQESDREYLSVKLDDPSFPAPIYASLVKIEDGQAST